MNTVVVKNPRVSVAHRTIAVAVVALIAIFILVFRWGVYGPYYNAHPVKDAEVYGQLVGLTLKERSAGNWEAEIILGGRNAGGRGGDTFEVTIPKDMVFEAMEYLTNGATMIVRYRSPSFYMRAESYSGNIATSIESAK